MKYTITVGRKMSLAPYESLSIEIVEEHDDKNDAEARDKVVSKLSKRLVNLCALERRRHADTLDEK